MTRTRAIRIAVIVVCVGGIAGMIATSVTNHNGAAITFGLITAVAILCQMVATTVVNEALDLPGAPLAGDHAQPAADADGALLEAGVIDLVAAGADEAAVRDLIRHAVRLGRRTGTVATSQASDS